MMRFEFNPMHSTQTLLERMPPMLETIKRPILMLALLFSVSAQAEDFMGGNSYFLVSESAGKGDFFADRGQGFQPLPAIPMNQTVLNVLKWVQFNQAPPRPTVKYNRNLHYGKWITISSNGNCLNTRGQVLVRDSQQAVQLNGGCNVATGVWHDPYSNRVIQDAAEIQIDHVVPAKNSYVSGAFAWSWQTRCAYFNFMGSRTHLLPVEGTENNIKGDKTPEGYQPPNRAYRCEYLANWLRIKMTWRLMLSENEARAISTSVQQLGCDPRLFMVRPSDLAQLRQLGQATAAACPAVPPAQRDNTPGDQ